MDLITGIWAFLIIIVAMLFSFWLGYELGKRNDAKDN